MSAKVNNQNCIKCGVCVASCPLAAVKFSKNTEIKVKEELCISCGNCEANCPANAIQIK